MPTDGLKADSHAPSGVLLRSDHQRRATGLLLLLTAGILVLLLWPLKQPSELGWMKLAWDWAHVPMFATWGWVLGRATSAKCWQRFGLNVVLLLVVVSVSEGLQFLSNRTPDVRDAVFGFLGGLAGLGLATAGGLKASSVHAPRWVQLMAALCLGATLLPGMSHALAVARYRVCFPELADLSQPGQWRFWSLEIGGVPQKWDQSRTKVYLPYLSQGLTSLHHLPQVHDWSGYSRLSLHGTLDAAAPVLLGIRIDVVGRTGPKRINLETRLAPGVNTVKLPLPDEVSQMRVKKVVFFTYDPGSVGTVVLDKVSLTPSS